MKRSPLDCFFTATSVAIIGASQKEHHIGHTLVNNIIKSNFPGKIFPIHPQYQEILGLKAYPTIGAVKEPIDLAIIAVPIKTVPGIIKECGEAGIKGAIIVSAGGKEIGEPGAKIEAEIKEAARKTGVRYVGPNCMGIICPPKNLNASLLEHTALPGNLAFISQSGAICSSILGWATLKKIGFSHFVNVGSMEDVDFADLFDYLADKENVRSIVVYLESLIGHRQFMSAARSVSRVKPIIAIKAGRSQAGARASASHTGALAGEDAAYSAAFRRAGIIRVDTIGQLFDCAEALGKMRRPLGSALGVITNAGGLGVMAADALSRWDLEPAPLSPETLAKLDEFIPPVWSRANPLDILGDATPERYARTVRICMEAPELSGLVIILSPQAETDSTGVAQAIAPEAKGKAKPVFAVWMGGQDVAEGVKILNDAGVPTFETPEPAVDTFMEMYFYSRHLELLQETPPRMPREITVNHKQARNFIDQCLARKARILSELESKAILSAYGIPINSTVAASSARDAAHEAKNLGFPVVLKINSPDIPHKSEAGGVCFNLHNEKEVMRAYEEMMHQVRSHHAQANILGVTVQTQETKPDLELLLGSQRDPDFGPLILFGLGGVFTEVLKDWAVDVPPLNLLLAKRLIQKTRAYQIIQGYRHIPPGNLDLMAEILVRMSQLVTDFPEIVELDINPLILSGDKVVAVDASLVIEPSTVKAPRHLIIAPYPNQYESFWMLRDGTPVMLRPMKPEDEPLAYDFLRKCSEETVYFRYFRLIRNWTHEMLIRFTQNDYDRELGLMAVGQPPGPELMMGVSRLFMDPDRETAEFAVIVADQWQGKGLGPKLVERVTEIAREQGVKVLGGDVLAENLPMREMVKKLGFQLKKDAEGATYRIEKEL
jgi:acetyltransferase